MMINEEKKLAFYHIPKNGGTSVRDALSLCGFKSPFETNFIELSGQKIDAKHQTPDEIRIRFPEIYKQVKPFRGIYIIRDPFERFTSSLSQNLKMYNNSIASSMTETQIINHVNEILSRLRNGEMAYDIIHFRRQSDYLNEDKNNHIIKMCQQHDLGEDLSKVVDEPVSVMRKNNRRHIKGIKTKFIKDALYPIYKHSPGKMQKAIKKIH